MKKKKFLKITVKQIFSPAKISRKFLKFEDFNKIFNKI